MVNKPTVISVFAGTGGSSLGYKYAGFKELLAIDFDKHAVECFKLNFPEIPVWHKSVIEITGQEILEFCKLKKRELDVFDGSPPCQGFSMAGKRKVNDPRNDLFKHYKRLIKELEPKVFIMENVSGMVKGKMKGRFVEIINSLKELNYSIKCKKMNAMYYGVPQSRERLIFIGVRKDLNKDPQFPLPSNNLIKICDVLPVKIEIEAPKFNDKELELVKKIRQGKCTLSLNINDVKKVIPSYSRKSYGSKLRRDIWIRPTYTITKQFRKLSAESRLHPKENRYYSISELLALSSFPINWKLGNNYKDCHARIGNAVMPKFMQAIAETIKNEILLK